MVWTDDRFNRYLLTFDVVRRYQDYNLLMLDHLLGYEDYSLISR